ncbi:hypothetical protein CDAR_126201 [Caerostris darwini]|uniref:Uncharacterized protein n=1 Tax=Caerostris darwini TaxID=1538125 RepID=A0AAV4S878_9ARAC|nr:hypothetical protein CDAR_126201 [Caerostris darwini]
MKCPRATPEGNQDRPNGNGQKRLKKQNANVFFHGHGLTSWGEGPAGQSRDQHPPAEVRTGNPGPGCNRRSACARVMPLNAPSPL